MKKKIKILLPITIIIITVLIVNTIMNNPPKTKRGFKKEKAGIKVETRLIQKQNYEMFIDSYGVIQASKKSALSTQVGGKIVYVSENFKEGAYIKKGEVLLKIEEADYKIDLQSAKAKLTLAEQALIEEQAKSIQAKEDWESFNKNQKANDLVLRKPQLESAKANVLIAKADLQKAQLNLKRTEIVAPYDARVDEKSVYLDELISSNTKIADISSSEIMEIKLPVNNNYLKYIDLKSKPMVKFFSNVTNKSYEGQILRSKSSIDTNTKQLYLIAELKNIDTNLNFGEYLKAKISTKNLQDVLIVPNSSIYQGSYVFVEKNGVIERRNIQITWQDENNALIKQGLKEGENLVLTILGDVSSGTKVKVINR